MTIKFRQFAAQDRRLTILLMLMNSPGYAASQYLLHSALPQFGHNVGMDELYADIEFMESVQLLEKNVVENVWLIRLTTRGVDVAQGRTEQGGVKRPLPE